MKQFIVTCASIVLIMIFPLQLAVDTRNANTIERVNMAVHSASQKARTHGYFTPEIITELSIAIEGILGNNTFEYSFNEDPTAFFDSIFDSGDTLFAFHYENVPKFRRGEAGDQERIYFTYKIKIPRLFAGASILGIDEEEEKYIYKIETFVLSERLS